MSGREAEKWAVTPEILEEMKRGEGYEAIVRDIAEGIFEKSGRARNAGAQHDPDAALADWFKAEAQFPRIMEMRRLRERVTRGHLSRKENIRMLTLWAIGACTDMQPSRIDPDSPIDRVETSFGAVIDAITILFNVEFPPVPEGLKTVGALIDALQKPLRKKRPKTKKRR
jgi:hypothetical protein